MRILIIHSASRALQNALNYVYEHHPEADVDLLTTSHAMEVQEEFDEVLTLERDTFSIEDPSHKLLNSLAERTYDLTIVLMNQAYDSSYNNVLEFTRRIPSEESLGVDVQGTIVDLSQFNGLGYRIQGFFYWFNRIILAKIRLLFSYSRVLPAFFLNLFGIDMGFNKNLNKNRGIKTDKVAFFLLQLRKGGAHRALINVANQLAGEGYDVEFVVGTRVGGFSDRLSGHVKVKELKTYTLFGSISRLVEYLNNNQDRCLLTTAQFRKSVAAIAGYLSDSNANIVLLESSTLSKVIEKLAIFSNLFDTLGYAKYFLLPYFASGFYPLADKLVACSRGSRDDLAKMVGCSTDDLDVINHPIDVDEIRRKSKVKLTHSWLFDPDILTFISAGRFSLAKNYETLLEAFHLVSQQKDSRLILLGDGDLRNKIDQKIDQLEIREIVELPGMVDNPWKYMSRSDCFVLSSIWEGCPFVLIEALAVGTQVVSTDCNSGPKEILDDGQYGRLVPTKDPSAMAEAMIETVNNPKPVDIIRSRGEKYDLPVIADQYKQVLGLEKTN